MAQGLDRAMFLRSAQGATLLCSKPITEAPKTEQSLGRPLSGWALHSHAACCHTHTHTHPHTHTENLFLLLASQARNVLSISREPRLLPFCLRWHLGRQELYNLVDQYTKQ